MDGGSQRLLSGDRMWRGVALGSPAVHHPGCIFTSPLKLATFAVLLEGFVIVRRVGASTTRRTPHALGPQSSLTYVDFFSRHRQRGREGKQLIVQRNS